MCMMSKRIIYKPLGMKIFNQMILKTLGDWLLKISNVKPKYTDIVMLENAHFIYDTLMRMSNKVEKCDFFESAVLYYRKLFDEHSSKYL